MKNKKSLIVIIGILIGFVVGLIIGITLTNPGMGLMEAAGTIGKMDTYRNVRVTEKDIELRNELLADASLREAYHNYLLYEYTVNVKMADDIQFSIRESDRLPKFWSANARTMERLEDYSMFLDNARLLILEAIGVINELDGRSQVAIRTVLNNAGNALAQTVYRSMVLFEFMEGVQHFIDVEGKEAHLQLAVAHDKLYANLLATCLVNENRPVLEHLLERDILTEDESLAISSEVLLSQFIHDANLLPSSSTLLSNAELLQSQNLGLAFFGSESVLSSSQQLSSFNEALNSILSSDIGQLGVIMSSIQHAGQLGFLEARKDAELLGVLGAAALNNIQHLSAAADLFNAQQLSLIIGAME